MDLHNNESGSGRIVSVVMMSEYGKVLGCFHAFTEWRLYKQPLQALMVTLSGNHKLKGK